MRPLDLATRVITKVEADEARVVVSEHVAGLTRFAESHIHQHVGEHTTSVSLTVVRDGRVASATTTSVTDDGLDAVVARAAEVADASPVDREWPGVAGPAAVIDPVHVAKDTLGATGADRAAIVKDFIDAGGGNAAGFCETEAITLAAVDTAGGAAEQQHTRATLDGIHRLPGGQSGSGHQTSTSIGDLDGALAGTQARRLADLARIEASADPGRYPVVLGPEAVGTICIFLSLYGFNAKSHQEGQSGIRVGEPQFDPGLVLVDDPTDPRSVGIGFDLEGSPTGPLPLIDRGRSAGLTHDRRTAHRAGTTSTGHGGPGTAVYGPLATSLLLDPSPDLVPTPVAEMANGLDRGLLITAFNYCRVVEPKTITVTGLTRNGTFLVQDGQIVGSLGNIRFTQSFLAGLGPDQVVAMGDDARLSSNEFGPGMTHVPSLHLGSWNITGDLRG